MTKVPNIVVRDIPKYMENKGPQTNATRIPTNILSSHLCVVCLCCLFVLFVCVVVFAVVCELKTSKWSKKVLEKISLCVKCHLDLSGELYETLCGKKRLVKQ